MYRTPAGDYVGADHPGPKVKVADSLKEFRRRLELLELLKAGAIQGLAFQKRFPLHGPDGTRVGVYVADFVYVAGGVRVVEDIKPRPKSEKARRALENTPAWKLYKLKRALMLGCYGITITEV